MAVTPAHRARVLRALGFTAWRRVAVPVAGAAPVPSADAVDCIVVLGAAAGARALDLLGRALLGAGPMLARAGRVTLDKGAAPDIPAARAYLVFGAGPADALRDCLAPDVREAARIVTVDELPAVLATAAAKRRLWHALREVRRAVGAGAH